MGSRNAVDGVTGAAGFRKMEEAADVVVLVKTRKEAFDISRVQGKGRERKRLAEGADTRPIKTNKLREGHKSNRAAGWRQETFLPRQIVLRVEEERQGVER